MSKSGNPYSLGDAKSVGKAVSSTSGKIAQAITTGFNAVTGIKKHKMALEHLANEEKLNREHEVTIAGVHHDNAKDFVSHVEGLTTGHKSTEVEYNPGGTIKYKTDRSPLSTAQAKATGTRKPAAKKPAVAKGK